MIALCIRLHFITLNKYLRGNKTDLYIHYYSVNLCD